MGFFNLKKSKEADVDEFEASDEWLMGLAGDDDYLDHSSGPNASIPQGLASLAPADDLIESDSLLPAGVEYPDLLDSENVDLSNWNFPDINPDTPAADSAMPPPPVAPSLELPARPLAEPEVVRPAEPLFDTRHEGAPVFEPYANDSIIEDGTLEDGTLEDGTLEDGTLQDDTVEDDTVDATRAEDVDGLGAIANAGVSSSAFVAANSDDLALRGTYDDGFLAMPTTDGVSSFGSGLFTSSLDGAIEDADIVDAGVEEDDVVGTVHAQGGGVADRPTVDERRIGEGSGAEVVAPRGHEPDLLCEILGVEHGATWTDLRAAYAAAMSEYDPRLESDEHRIVLARAIRREMNSTYATLRLLSVA